ncbi:ABC transporter ATP-binding protein [Alkalihalobacillus alcalophilus ATCC 27647 = CGMCC 1.3604]|uniref:ABC transporter ATP-binding protein n=1 Tax=Alkalihalobacillus alcalophilus ATCC 27647 = CGMCC 1.3604 TaxID=1218173 RepID=J8TNY0_ALKAL|nr:ABC-F type ribosomal protection protein [Alkalihalobacillus alcalophilus]AFV25913.1 unknown transporter [Alkalihalobacillus alcalophilus ATCC 27647 = CGMCC 1.3604]KGA97674.1 ABC transporter ATP-binding protein [Alkalihalobacillus alcalophilus ATCC 27647 = CGMCC 1.3604]MED1561781.1 ABC-F type ribosomal protection protein [Alkalihalobacillus alcalophilus]THG91962.1 ABC transporter ATP-binding protein [Alkalihalobacillus alcalophilus ATCC 27647 = CGMCC 1.3604]
MILCQIKDITKDYGGHTIFEQLSFEIKTGEKIGLVGRNGSGKSTLMKIIAKAETSDNGQIHVQKNRQVGYLSQGQTTIFAGTARDFLLTAFSTLIQMEKKIRKLETEMPHQSGKDLEKFMHEYGELQEQFSHLGGYKIEANIEQVAAGLKASHLLDHPFSNLSGGEQTKIELARALLRKPDLLLLDEPTNHLDLNAIEWLTQFLQNYPGTFMVISHDRYFLDETVERIIDLEDGELHNYLTNYSGFVKEKEERLLKEFQAYQEQQKKIKKMKEAIKRLREWANQANPPNEGLHKRARNMERALERIEKLNRPTLNHKKMNLDFQTAHRSGKDVLSIKDLRKGYDGRELFSDVNMHVQYQERVALIGENGTGKSTFLKLILGQETVDAGEIKRGSNIKIGYLSQKLYSEQTKRTVIEEFREHVMLTEGEARQILAQFLFYGHRVFNQVSSLSGGEKMRLRLAILMQQNVNLFVLDEPTNHLDIESREVLEDTLENYNGTILAVSHDRYFLNKLFTKIYWLENKSLYSFNGDYEWAKQKITEIRLQQEKHVSKKEQPTKEDIQVRPKREKSKTFDFEKEVFLLEEQIAALDEQLQMEVDLATLQELYQKKEQLELKWEQLVEEIQ